MSGVAAFDLLGADGTRLSGTSWRAPGTSKALVALAHGVAEHSGRYEHVIAALRVHGYGVYAMDHRGHGRSGGPRASIARFDDYVDDFDLLVQRARQQHPTTPVFVLGHSMGGLIAARYALRHQAELAGLVLSGPVLVIDEHVPRWQKRLLLAIARIAPETALIPSTPGVLSANRTSNGSSAPTPCATTVARGSTLPASS